MNETLILKKNPEPTTTPACVLCEEPVPLWTKWAVFVEGGGRVCRNCVRAYERELEPFCNHI